MFCSQCSNDLADCSCTDLQERLQAAAQSPHFAYKKCSICGNHYAKCSCKVPKYVIEGPGESND